MKQLLFVSLLSVLSFQLTAQIAVKSTMDILVGYDSTFRTIDGNGSTTEMVRNDLELRKGNLHVGFNFNRRLSQKLFFKTGLRFVSMGYKTKNQELVFPDMSIVNIFFTYDYQFLEVPLHLRYQLGEKLWQPYAELGVSPMYLFGTKKVESKEGQEDISFREPVSDEFNEIHLGVYGAMGIQYVTVGDESTYFLQANFNYDMTNLVDSDNFKENLYGFGIEFGVRRALSIDY